MWSDRLVLGAALTALAGPALADYAHAPFHDRPFEVADLALRVLDGEAVPVPQDDVPLAAAVAAFLLVSELGVAEAYEEAVEGEEEEEGEDEGEAEGDPYGAAHALLQTVKPWIAAVPQDAELADLVARLDALMPTPERPDVMDADPEAGEVVAQALVGQLERAADADLYLGRDLGRALDTVSRLATDGCATDEAARPRWFEITALYYEDALEAPVSVMAAEPAERIEADLDALLSGDLSGCDSIGDAFTTARESLFP
ncbi:hypothetical protein [Roseivivax isoporae]|uniref:Uncharacterized protein n=1 Tax=Roseivivax isoporae LMG 25204 TaxID=1449351 RepID=X7F4G9_9RHOB|nr:hypothetical protein [Roseivivax isoporae]ETX27817.1 hypothetical protein RISW2_10820 [Roseivivax isoporae LMG 25204]